MDVVAARSLATEGLLVHYYNCAFKVKTGRNGWQTGELYQTITSQYVCIYKFVLSSFNLHLLIVPQSCLQMNRRVRSALLVICGLASPPLLPKKIANSSHAKE